MLYKDRVKLQIILNINYKLITFSLAPGLALKTRVKISSPKKAQEQVDILQVIIEGFLLINSYFIELNSHCQVNNLVIIIENDRVIKIYNI